MDRLKLLKSKGYWTEYIYAQKYNNKSNEEIAEGITKAIEQVETLAKHNEALDIVIPRFVYRKLQKNEHHSVMEIGENDNPRSHPDLWCDRRVCEGFWGNEEDAKKWVGKMNEV